MTSSRFFREIGRIFHSQSLQTLIGVIFCDPRERIKGGLCFED